MTDNREELLTVPQVAEWFRMSSQGVRNLIARGELPAIPVPSFRGARRVGRWLVRESVIREKLSEWENGEN